MPSAASSSNPRAQRLVLVAMIFAVAMMFIDQTIVVLAVPDLEKDLSLSANGATWIVNGYLLSLSALFARRMPLGRVAVMALAWIGIFATGLMIVALVNRNDWLVSGTRELFYGRDQSVVGDEVRVDGWQLTVAELDGRRVSRVGLARLAP